MNISGADALHVPFSVIYALRKSIQAFTYIMLSLLVNKGLLRLLLLSLWLWERSPNDTSLGTLLVRKSFPSFSIFNRYFILYFCQQKAKNPTSLY